MNPKNKEIWSNLEEMVKVYSLETETLKKEVILTNIFLEMKDYLTITVNNAHMKTKYYGLQIPKEDFESRYMQYLWEAVESFQNSESTFKNIVMRRFDFAEKHTWKQYKTKGNKNDKDGVSYDSARIDSLERRLTSFCSEKERIVEDITFWVVYSAEDEFLEKEEVRTIISDFEKVNQRYANVIRYMALGYKGDDLAIVTGEADSNNPKFRKLLQRTKKSFALFMEKRAS